MGDVVSSHLDENKRGMIAAETQDVMKDFSCIYEQQYSVALFNSVRSEIEGVGATHSQLLHRKDPLADRTIFSGSLLQYLEENRKWRNRYVSVPSSYILDLYENKMACERGLQPKVSINCAGYKVLTSVEDYMELMNQSLPGVKAKVDNAPFIKLVTEYALILWHPYHRHHYFCVLTEREQRKWFAVLQDCVRHCNNGLPEESMIQTPAFTNSIRLYRQAQGHYGSWDKMCGAPPQILANLVMESLHPKLRELIAPRLKGKMQQRQRSWMLICGAVYRQVLAQTSAQYEALCEACEAQRGPLDAALRTDMDQIITSKEHVSNKIKAVVLPKAEQLLRTSVQPYVSSILEALMEPTSRGFSEVRDVFFRELVELSKNSLDQDKDKLGEHMERVSMLAFHPVKMQSCYEVVEELNLEGLQQRFDVSSPDVFIGRAQILMREQMDNTVYTFEQLLNQLLEAQGESDLCKTIQKSQDRVLKKYDYDSSTVRKKFFREALLQIIVPYMLQQLAPSCSPELPQFQELIFEDFSRFLLVENLYEEVVLQSVTKDIMSAVKEAAVQRRHNLYRDSIVLTSSDPNLHLLEEKDPVDWSSKFTPEESPVTDQTGSTDEIKTSSSERGTTSNKKRRQVVSMIQIEGVPLPYESCLEVPGVDFIPEEYSLSSQDEELQKDLKSPDSVYQIRDLINPVVEVVLPVSDEEDVSNGTELTTGTVVMEDGIQEEVTHVTTMLDKVPRSSIKVKNVMEMNMQKDLSPIINMENVIMEEEKVPQNPIKIKNETKVDVEKEPSPITKTFPEIDMENKKLAMIEKTVTSAQIEDFIETKTETCSDIETSKKSPQSMLQQLMGSKRQEEEAAIKSAIRELEIAVQEEDSDGNTYGPDSDSDVSPPQQIQVTDYSSHDDSGFQSPVNDRLDSVEDQPITNGLNVVDRIVDPAGVEVFLT